MDLHGGAPQGPEEHAWTPGAVFSQCTMLSGHGMEKVRIGLVLVQAGGQQVIEERQYRWDKWEIDSPDGVRARNAVGGLAQVQFIKDARKHHVRVDLLAGFEQHVGWDYTIEPKPVTVETGLTEISAWSNPGPKAPREVHLAHVFVFEGSEMPAASSIKSVADLAKATKGNANRYLVTTLYWEPAQAPEARDRRE